MTPSKFTMTPSLVALVCCLSLGSAVSHAQNTGTLTPPGARISDQAIAADQAVYEQLHGRIQALNATGRPLRDYHLAKAQCWLDVSLHEYNRNDRSAFVQAALTESEKLVAGMERKVSPLPMDTPLVNEAARLRPDLWDSAQGLRSHAGWSCAQAKAACAEVELVHAGNEYNQQQWRHARPYVQIAEGMVEQAQAAATACAAALPVPVPTQPLAAASAPVAVPAAPSVPMELAANVVFNFDKFAAGDIRAFSLDSLRRLVEQAKDKRIQVKEIRLIGHADRLNGTGQRDYNEQLSSKRAQTVRQWLIDAGLSAAAIRFEFVGDRQPVAQCQGKLRSNTELEECLLPNRRVEVQLLGQRLP